MTRASEAADGAFVNAIVYQDQYNTARARARIAQSRRSQKMFAVGPKPAADCAAREMIC
jgi:hypothetical protein